MIFSLVNIKIIPDATNIIVNTALSIGTLGLQCGLLSLPATEHQHGENTSQLKGGGGLVIVSRC